MLQVSSWKIRLRPGLTEFTLIIKKAGSFRAGKIRLPLPIGFLTIARWLPSRPELMGFISNIKMLFTTHRTLSIRTGYSVPLVQGIACWPDSRLQYYKKKIRKNGPDSLRPAAVPTVFIHN